MKAAYVICAVLAVTIGTLVLADNGTPRAASGSPIIPLNPTAEIIKKDAITTSEPLSTHETTTEGTTITTTPATTSSTTTPTTKPTTKTTTPIPVPTNPNATTTPTTKPTIAPTTVAPKPTTTNPAPTSSSTASSHPTTPVPTPSKDRHFDGLSFFGGIILTTCLMAISVFSWKFYRQCKEGNYRTL